MNVSASFVSDASFFCNQNIFRQLLYWKKTNLVLLKTNRLSSSVDYDEDATETHVISTTSFKSLTIFFLSDGVVFSFALYSFTIRRSTRRIEDLTLSETNSFLIWKHISTSRRGVIVKWLFTTSAASHRHLRLRSVSPRLTMDTSILLRRSSTLSITSDSTTILCQCDQISPLSCSCRVPRVVHDSWLISDRNLWLIYIDGKTTSRQWNCASTDN